MDIKQQIALLNEVDKGRLDGIACPECNSDSVSVWFTNPTVDEYKTWLVCAKCNFYARFQNSTKPKQFCIDRINNQLQNYDDEIVCKRTSHYPDGIEPTNDEGKKKGRESF